MMTVGLKSLPSRPRRLFLTFGLVTLLPTVGLVWLGATLLSQDRQLAEKQLSDQLERKLDSIVADLLHDVAIPSVPATAASVSAPPVVAPTLWERGAEAERQRRFDSALLEYQRIAISADLQVRAEALIRVARVLRQAGRHDEALAVYGQLKGIDDIRFLDAPVSLEAGLATVRVLGAEAQADRRDLEAAAIRQGLREGRWRVDQPTLENAWSQVSSPQMFAGEWEARWRELGVAVSLTDASTGSVVIESGPLSGPGAVRSAPESKLPWTIRIASAEPTAEIAAFGSRRRNLLLVLSLAAFLVLAGAYFVARGIRRELAVAELQSSFVSAVSHEFRTPLTSMSHLIELLRDRPNLDETRRAKYYEALEQESDRLRRFVDRLLTFGRVDAGAARYQFEPAEAADLVSRVVESFRAAPAAQEHPITCDLATGPEVAVDQEAFTLALNNLLENAAKYSPPGAAIGVGIERDATRRTVAIHVRDQGQGVPSSEQHVIFDKFVRGAAAQASGIRGTGVGLALARDIIRAHGGDIHVNSEPGRGSTFTITLPVSRAASADRVGSAAREAHV